MKISTDKRYLLTWLSVLLVVGFLCTSIAGYWVSRDSIIQGIAAQELPLTGDNIYSELQKDILRPIFISSLMAHDTFLRDWVLKGEKEVGEITRYLKMVKDEYGTISSFFVSEMTRKYYYPDGVLKIVREGEPRDAWFFRVRSMVPRYETNVDPDMANRDTMTIFINYRVFDYDGLFIGVAGVGLTFDTVRNIIDDYQERFRRRIFFADKEGRIVLAGKSMRDISGSIREMHGLRDSADKILNTGSIPITLQYHDGKDTVLLNSRYITELGWYLVVEKNQSEALKPVRQVLVMNLSVSIIVTLLVLMITVFSVNRYQTRLEQMATTDQLTGLLNRQGFEIVFQQMIRDSERYNSELSLILFDIDHFKVVNDQFGHLTGDKILQEISVITKDAVRKSDVVARWGGEEFLVLLKNCSLEQSVEVAEKVRMAFVNRSLVPPAGKITVSLGVARYRQGEPGDSFIDRADKALYLAKANGRNRTEVSHP